MSFAQFITSVKENCSVYETLLLLLLLLENEKVTWRAFIARRLGGRFIEIRKYYQNVFAFVVLVIPLSYRPMISTIYSSVIYKMASYIIHFQYATELAQRVAMHSQ